MAQQNLRRKVPSSRKERYNNQREVRKGFMVPKESRGEWSSPQSPPEGAASCMLRAVGSDEEVYPSAPALRERQGNLPSETSSFVGRERELPEVGGLLAETRLLTLTGPGGCGKTRLALRVARGAEEDFGQGVWWVDLAPLSDPDLVA